ncbi:MAG: hypothetical protein LQ349_006813 [Xanthoria aureola]|nr:MAG: hypothetical protein LQ349_006813 [Xanthoria aureola]
MTSGPAHEYPSSSTKSTNTLNYKENASTTPERSNASEKNTNGFIRSASSTQLPNLAGPNVTPGENPLRRTLSENVLIDYQGNLPGVRYRGKIDVKDAGNGGGKNAKHAISLGLGPKIAVSRFSLDPSGAEEDEEEDEEVLELRGTKGFQPPIQDEKVSAIPRSLSRFARRPWVSRSRSSSPSPLVLDLERKSETSPRVPKSLSSSALKSLTDSTTPDHSSKGRRRPLSVLMGKVPSDSSVPSVPAIPKSLSTDKLPSIPNKSSGQPPAVRRLTSWEPSQGTGNDSPRRKDELSSTFRTLDGDFQKHTAVVRSTLLPYLRTYANHPSNATLRPEDLDRRINTLNKWWTGLLTMLIGRNGESVSGSDRPTILDAVTSIMVRPEWILPYQAISSPLDRNARPFSKSRSTTSLASEQSDFLAESVFHNVKSIYAEKLMCQMAYVVEKMSSRCVPASVVSFCGKATAYAFFYCDGVADILVRLWATPPEMIRRVLAEHHLARDADLKSSMNSVIRSFPSRLHGLGFRSVKATVQYLRSRSRFPLGAARVDWHGPWVRRWAGRDTDLFFIFTRNYYNLMDDYLPPDLMFQGRLCAPGHVLLQAQLLGVLESVVLRSDTQSLLEPALGSSVGYNGVFGEADASAPVLPLSPAATSRSIAENRLIILLRDYLFGSSSVSERPKEIFAGSFECLLKAAARRVSVFNYNASFALCDFMEEALAILHRYSTSSASNYTALDWPFWLSVCRQMMSSQNTMTQLRVYAFLYSLWSTITADANRKHHVCLEWLLDEEYFYAQFNHWCPMVRAYYMRLLCWRVGRLGVSSSDLDTSILKTLAKRLDYVWCTFLYLQGDIRTKGGPRLSTAPCRPAPSRHLLVVRHDSQPTPGGMYLTFDSILSLPSSTQSIANERHSSLNTSTGSKESSATRKPASVGRKSWSMLKNMMSFTTSATEPPASSVGENNGKLKGGSTQSPRKRSGQSSPPERQETPVFRAHSFKFSLEWTGDETRHFGKERQLYRPQLPGPPSNCIERPEINAADLSLYQPQGGAINVGKYAGRALAEWDLVLAEFKEFCDRRRAEGVPNQSQIETPTLGVETFRRYG